MTKYNMTKKQRSAQDRVRWCRWIRNLLFWQNADDDYRVAQIKIPQQ